MPCWMKQESGMKRIKMVLKETLTSQLLMVV